MSSYVCYVTSMKDRQGLDSLYGYRVMSEVFHKGIHSCVSFGRVLYISDSVLISHLLSFGDE